MISTNVHEKLLVVWLDWKDHSRKKLVKGAARLKISIKYPCMWPCQTFESKYTGKNQVKFVQESL